MACVVAAVDALKKMTISCRFSWICVQRRYGCGAAVERDLDNRPKRVIMREDSVNDDWLTGIRRITGTC